MAATSTARNACNAAIWFDNAAGTATDISGSMNMVTIDLQRTLGEYTVFGACITYRLQCGRDATFTLNIHYSTSATEAERLLAVWATDTSCTSTPRTLSIYLPDKNVGSEHWSCEVLLESFNIVADHGNAGPMTVTAVLKPANSDVIYTIAST